MTNNRNFAPFYKPFGAKLFFLAWVERVSCVCLCFIDLVLFVFYFFFTRLLFVLIFKLNNPIIKVRRWSCRSANKRETEPRANKSRQVAPQKLLQLIADSVTRQSLIVMAWQHISAHACVSMTVAHQICWLVHQTVLRIVTTQHKTGRANTLRVLVTSLAKKVQIFLCWHVIFVCCLVLCCFLLCSNMYVTN